MITTARRMLVFCAIVIVTLTGIVACDSNVSDESLAPPTATTQRWPATDFYEVPDRIVDSTMVWTAAPGVDLFSVEGTLVRAAHESVAIGWLIGLDYTYIGFAASSDSVAGGPLHSLFQSDTGQGPFVGTVHGHIQQIIPTDDGFDVVSCILAVGLDRFEGGKYRPSLLTNGDGQELRSRFIRNEDASRPPDARRPSRDGGLHWQAPVGNRFAGWDIDGFVDLDPVTSGNGRCVPWAKSLYPDAPRVILDDAYDREDPPPREPAYPGWPNGSN